ncbi:MAG: hypothetical protein FK734_10640 [Asgard group archaeon]|nr:hypothetical protein [Asgard group archaeon]
MAYKPMAHIIEDIVTDVRNNFSVEKIIPFYDYGTIHEVVNRITLKSEDTNYFDKLFPLIWFLIDDVITESIDYKKASYRLFKNCSIVICTNTKAEYSTADRYNNTIIPTLRPLYESFMYYLKLNNQIIGTETKYAHQYTENLFWGRGGVYGHEGNIFNDLVDAIIISGLDLYIVNKC